jgi:hypothetical protein
MPSSPLPNSTIDWGTNIPFAFRIFHYGCTRYVNIYQDQIRLNFFVIEVLYRIQSLPDDLFHAQTQVLNF